MIAILWPAYLLAQTANLLVIIVASLVATSFVGLGLFARDLLKGARSNPTFERSVCFIIIAVCVSLTIVYGLSMPFRLAGDAYGYYAPIGAYIDRNPDTFLSSAYRYSLTRDFGYYAIFAHSNLLGLFLGLPEVYRLLPTPFVLGMLLGALSTAQRLSKDSQFGLLSLAILVFSVYMLLLLKYNMFYLGNLLMVTLSLLYCQLLLTKTFETADKISLAVSTFAFPLLYNFTLVLVVPFLVAFLAKRKPRLTALAWALVALFSVTLLGLSQTTLGFAQVQRLDLLSVVTLLSLSLIVSLTIWTSRHSAEKEVSPGWRLFLVAAIAALLSVLSQGLANILNFGFFSLETYEFSSVVMTYMERNYWFYTQRVDTPSTLISLLLSDVFFGWGFLLTLAGLIRHRASPISVYFLAVLPLILIVESLSGNYFRYALFIGPLVALFLAVGMRDLLGILALPFSLLASTLTLLQRFVITFPSVDYEHKVFLDFWYVPVQLAVASVFLVHYFIARRKGGRTFSLVGRGYSAGIRRNSRFRQARLMAVILLITCTGLLGSSLMASKYIPEVYPDDVVQLSTKVLPLIREDSKVLTVELVHPNFQLQRRLEVMELAQPWHLENFLRDSINSTESLVDWIKTNRFEYVLLDRGFTAGNGDVFGFFEQLMRDCPNFDDCFVMFDDGRFVLLEFAYV